MLRNELAPSISLDGVWDFALGEGAGWGAVEVPGCWEAQGYAKGIDGPARYRREAVIPEEWAGQRAVVEFDAVSYACTIWVNGQRTPALPGTASGASRGRCAPERSQRPPAGSAGASVGEHRGMWTPFAFDVTDVLRPGQSNTIELEVYKPGQRYPVRQTLAGFLPDVATTFGGIWQGCRLRAFVAGLDDVRIATDPATGSLALGCRVVTFEPFRNLWLRVDVFRNGRPVTGRVLRVEPSGRVDATIGVPDFLRWSPQQPALYDVRLRVYQGDWVLAEATERVGFRSLTTQGEQLLLNGQPICLRGVLSWGWDPQRIAPNLDPDAVRREMQRLAALGFNLVKLCLFVPQRSTYDIADEEGMLLWQEWPMWLPETTEEVRALAAVEYAEYMALTRHHPSVVVYSIGCELGWSVDEAFLRQLDTVVRTAAAHQVEPATRSLQPGTFSLQPNANVLFCDNSGSGEAYGGTSADFADFSDYHTYCDLNFLEPMLDHWRRDWRPARPLLFGEFCDSDGFRDVREIVAANGGERPWWMTADNPVHTWRPETVALIEEEARLSQAGLGFAADELRRIADAQSLVVRKTTLETIRSRAEVQGYVITGLRDTPIATSGIFDDLGRPKWPAEEFRPFNDDAILCLDAPRRRSWQHGGDRPDRLDPYNWWSGETATLHVILSNAGRPFGQGAKLTWRLIDAEGMAVTEGATGIDRPLPAGRPVELAEIEFPLPEVSEAQELCLEVRLKDDEQIAANRWSLWCYPRPQWPPRIAMHDPAGLLADVAPWLEAHRRFDPVDERAPVVLASAFDAGLESYVRNGGRVLLLQSGDGPLPAWRGPFWREAIKLFPQHPLWAAFPQRGYTGMQFFGLANDAAFDLPALRAALAGAEIHPVMRRLDAREFHVKEYIVEAQIGRGRLLACTLRPQGGYGAGPSPRNNVAGHYLLWTMIDYLSRSLDNDRQPA